LLAVLLLVSVTFVTLDYRMADHTPLSELRTGVATVFGPVQRAVNSAASPLIGAVRGLGSVVGDRGKVRALQRDNADLRGRLRSAELDQSRAAQLRRLDLLAGLGRYTVVRGQVVALGPSAGLEWTITIDLGSRDGVREGMTVVNGEGLVGRVKRTAPYTSTVLLAVDPFSSVGSRLAGSGELGITAGEGMIPMRLTLLDPQAPLRIGDRLVTGPYGQTTFAPGVPIGTVTGVTTSSAGLVRVAEVQPYVDFTSLDVVGVVVRKPRSDPRDAVLPPAPARSPAPGSRGSSRTGPRRP
jgi:rod shape-determining protein MreC